MAAGGLPGLHHNCASFGTRLRLYKLVAFLGRPKNSLYPPEDPVPKQIIRMKSNQFLQTYTMAKGMTCFFFSLHELIFLHMKIELKLETNET